MPDSVATEQNTSKPKPPKRRKARREYGSGAIRLKSGAWHLQYRVADPSDSTDGKSKWIWKSLKLADRSDEYPTSTCSAVRILAAAKLTELRNAGTESQPGPMPDMTVADFWQSVYLPWAEDINPKVGEPNLRASTLEGYQHIWDKHLKDAFGTRTLSSWTPVDGTQLLDRLAKTLNRNSLHHVRSLASGIFRLAIAKGYLHPDANDPKLVNPWKHATATTKTIAPKRTQHYTLQEVLNILAALEDYPECRLVMALAFFGGLRPGEIRGLKIEDFTAETSDNCPVCAEEGWDISVSHFHVRRSIDKSGNVTKPKTEESEGPLPLMVPIALALREWITMRGNPTSGWLFPTKNDTPMDLRDMARTKIRPTLKAKKLPWKALYAGRRGAATLLLRLSGDALASQQLLRHAPGSAVTAKHYIKAIPEALLRGAVLVEAEVTKALAEANGGNGKGNSNDGN